jgi:hypothetical protein
LVEELEKRRRAGWRRVRRVVAIVVATAVLLVIVGPSLIPSAILSGVIRERIEAALGRPVRVENCRIGWLKGLRIGELWVAAEKNPDDWLLHVEGLTVKVEPWELSRAADAQTPYLGRVTVARLTVRLLPGKESPEAAAKESPEQADSSGPPPDFKSIQVLDGEVLLDDPKAGLHRRVTGLRFTLGRLSGSNRAYVTGSGRLLLPDANGSVSTGLVSLNGLFDHFDLNRLATTTGGCDVDWDGVDLAYFLPPLGTVEQAQVLEAPTEGQAKITFDLSPQIGVEGRLDLSRLAFGRARELPQVDLERLTVGFNATVNKLTGGITIKPSLLSGAGSSLQISGQITGGPDGQPAGQLHVAGTLALGPLRQNVPALATATAVTGLVGIEKLDLALAGDALEVVDSRIDLRRAEIDLKPWFVKPVDRDAVLVVKARLDGAKQDFQLHEASLSIGRAESGAAQPADLRIVASTPGEQKKNASGNLQPWSRTAEVKVSVADARTLPEYVSVAQEWADELHLSGSAVLTTSVDPQPAGLAVALRLEGSGLGFEMAPGVGKAAGMPFGLVVGGRLPNGSNGIGLLYELNHIETMLGLGSLTFDGSLGGKAALPNEGHWPHARFDGRVEGKAVQEWVRLARPFLPAEPYAALVGNLSCDLGGHVDDAGFTLEAQVDATRMSLELQPAAGRAGEADRLFIKPLGRTAEGRMMVSYSRSAGRLSLTSNSMLEETSFGFDAVAEGGGGAVAALAAGAAADQIAPRYLSARLAVKSTNVESLLRYSPAVQARTAPLHPSGGLDGQVRLAVGDQVSVTMSLDLGSTCYEVPGEIFKPAGLPQKLELSLALPRRPSGAQAECRIEKCLLTTGPTVVRCAGRLDLDLDVLRGAAADPAELLRALRRTEATVRIDLVQDERLKSYCRRWREFSDHCQFVGRATAEVRVAGTRAGGRLSVILDATPAGFQYGDGTTKPVGTPARLEAALETGTMVGEGLIEKFEFTIADTRAACTGMLYWRGQLPARAEDFTGFSLHAEGQSEQAARLARLLPVTWLRQANPQGGFTFALDLAGDSYGLDLDRADFQFRHFRAGGAAAALALDGRATLTRRRLQAENFAVGVGDSAILITADLADPLVAPRGRIAVSGQSLDLDALLAAFGSEPAKPTATPSGGQTPPSGIPPGWPKIAAFLGRANVELQVALDKFVWSDNDDIHYEWTAFTGDAALADGHLTVKQWQAGMLGGTGQGRAMIDLTEANPSARVEYETRDLAGGPGLDALVVQLFPNMTIKGRGAQSYQGVERFFQVPGQPSSAVGTSYFEATDGSLVGPAAPDWLTNLLPGLKLTTFNFNRVKSYTTLKADGSAVNDMLFDGTPYCLRIMGTTTADGRTEYLLAVDLFNGVRHETLSRDLQQGIVPILRYTGRIRNSKWDDMDINFLMPYEVAYEVFLKRNLLYQLLEKSGESRRPDFSPYDMTKPPPPK